MMMMKQSLKLLFITDKSFVRSTLWRLRACRDWGRSRHLTYPVEAGSVSSVGLCRHLTYPVEAGSVSSVGLCRHLTYPVEAGSVSSVGLCRHHTYPVEAGSVSSVGLWRLGVCRVLV